MNILYITYHNLFLQENDIIFSGTPKGVDKLKVGDKLEGYIENEKFLILILFSIIHFKSGLGFIISN